MTFAKAHKFIVTCYWERDSRPCVLSLRDVARKGEASAFALQKLGWQATKQPFLEIIDKIRTNMLVSPVISETEMESRDFSHPEAMYSKCAHSVAFERFLHVFAKFIQALRCFCRNISEQANLLSFEQAQPLSQMNTELRHLKRQYLHQQLSSHWNTETHNSKPCSSCRAELAP